jgi:hypothetical protein
MLTAQFRSLSSLEVATERACCEKCGAATMLTGVTQKAYDADLCTFECAKCGHKETSYVSYE